MKKHCFTIGILMTAAVAAQTTQIFKWTDGNGNVHFSDKPAPGAEEIQLPTAQTYSSPSVTTPSSSNESVAENKPIKYDKVIIIKPEDQETVRNAQGSISVVLDIQPKLMPGDKVQLIFDDSPVGEPQASNVISLLDIDRGSHTLQAQIIDSNENILLKSSAITFFMMPPRVGMVHRGA